MISLRRTTILQKTAVFATALLIGVSPVNMADDTDVYLLPTGISRDDSPNVLIIFDNSASMADNTTLSEEAYDPSVDYATAHTLDISFDTSRIYWSPVSQNSINLATLNSSNQYFPAVANKCESSINALASSGFSQQQVVGWDSASDGGSGSWEPFGDPAATSLNTTALTTNNHVECNESPAGTGTNQDYLDRRPNRSWANRYTNSAQQAYNWSHGSTYLYNGNFLNYKQYIEQSGGATSTVTRLQVAKNAVKAIIDAVPNVRMGLMVLNRNDDSSTSNGGRVIMGIDAMNSTRRAEMKQLIDDVGGHSTLLDATCDTTVDGVTYNHGGTSATGCPTPTDSWAEDTTAANRSGLTEALWEAYNYLAGKAVEYGDDDNSLVNSLVGDIATKLAADLLLDPSALPAVNPHPPMDTSTTEDVDGVGTYVSPFSIECQQAYIIIVSDFEPKNDDAANDSDHIAGLSGISACTDGAGNSCLDQLAGWMYDNDLCGDNCRWHDANNTAQTGLNGTQRAIVHTVGVGALGNDATELAQTTATNGKGLYTSAASLGAMIDALQSTFTQIQTKASSFAAPTLSVNAFNKLFNRSDVYFALFQPDTDLYWEGNVKKFYVSDDLTNCDGVEGLLAANCKYGKVVDKNDALAIDDVTQRIDDSASSEWSSTDGGFVTEGGVGAQIRTAGPDNRKLYTLTSYAGLTFPVTTDASTYAVTATSGQQLYNAAVTDPSILGITSVTAADAQADREAEVAKMINWMRGADSYDSDNNSSTTDRWPLADPLHSRPVAVTYGAVPCTSSDVSNSSSACYGATAGDPNPSKPITRLFMGTNDGVIHMINDASGAEEWAFLVPEKLANQYSLAQDLSGDHVYGVDGTASFWIQDNSRDSGNNIVGTPDGYINPTDGDFVYMYITMRRGGKNIYAFNVTPDAKMTSTSTANIHPKLMWVIKGGTGGTTGYTLLGQTWSRPQAVSVRYDCGGNTNCDDGNPDTPDSQAKTVLIFGGGYDSANQDSTINTTGGTGADTSGAGIYIVEPSTGALILRIGSDANAHLQVPKMDFSIPSDLAIFDSDGDGEMDRIYVGDTGGQLWRIDLGTQLASASAGGTTAGRLADVACTTGSRPDCTNTAVQDRRKFFYPPDVVQARDSLNSAVPDYDIVTIASGDRADPTDSQTEGNTDGSGNADPILSVKNRLYAFRDYQITNTIAQTSGSAPTNYPLCHDTNNGGLTNCSTPLNESDNLLNRTTDVAASLSQAEGWYIDLKESTAQSTPAGNSQWVGEKGLARTVIFGGTLFATTFVPASDVTADITCSRDEGLGRLYAVNVLNAAAVFDYDGSGSVGLSDRIQDVGGGIPSELVTVIREGGVTGLVGVSGGATDPFVSFKGDTKFVTFWVEE